MDGTILSQGSFIVPAAIAPVSLVVPSGVDWMRVINYTRQGTVGGAAAYGFEYTWQRGMPAGTALVKYYANGGAVVTGDRLVSGGFNLFDASASRIGSSAAIVTGTSNATQPVVTTTATTGVAVGSVVRIFSPGQPSISGVDMVVSAVNAGVSFTLLAATNPLATAPGAAGLWGSYVIVNNDPLFYPRKRFISNITQAANAVITTTVAHGYVVGQAVRFNIPSISGMIQLNPTAQNNYLYATVVAVSNINSFSINIDSSAFVAFTSPTSLQAAASWPSVFPLGEDTASALSINASQVPTDANGNLIYNANSGILSDATVNTGYIGMTLGTGGVGNVAGAVAITGPAGSVAADVVYWVAGKSSYGGL